VGFRESTRHNLNKRNGRSEATCLAEGSWQKLPSRTDAGQDALARS
jgi:hypothetical protein